MCAVGLWEAQIAWDREKTCNYPCLGLVYFIFFMYCKAWGPVY